MYFFNSFDFKRIYEQIYVFFKYNGCFRDSERLLAIVTDHSR